MYRCVISGACAQLNGMSKADVQDSSAAAAAAALRVGFGRVSQGVQQEGAKGWGASGREELEGWRVISERLVKAAGEQPELRQVHIWGAALDDSGVGNV